MIDFVSLHCVVGVKLALSASVSSVRNVGRDEHGTSAQASMVLCSVERCDVSNYLTRCHSIPVVWKEGGGGVVLDRAACSAV